jgi:hypothetical protein
MILMAIIGVILVYTGIVQLREYIQEKRWPVVDGALESVNLKIESAGPTEAVGFFFNHKFIHKIRYSYRGHPYLIEISKKEVIGDDLKLRVNPEKPYVASLAGDESALFPVLAIIGGFSLLFFSIKMCSNNE